jgi:hypothetical protein
MCVPDVLAIVLTRRDQHRKLLDLLRERRFGTQILVQGIHVLLRLGHVDDHGGRAVTRDGSVAFDELVERGTLVFGNVLPAC